MRWYFPSWNGDVRVESDPDDAERTLLTIIEPTQDELRVLGSCLPLFKGKNWLKGDVLWDPKGNANKQVVVLRAPIVEIGLLLVHKLKPGLATLTAVKFEDGSVEAMGASEQGFLGWVNRLLGSDGKEMGSVAALADALEAESLDENAPEGSPHRREAKEPEKEEKKEEKKKKPKAAASAKRPTTCCPQSISGEISPATEVLLEFLTPEQREQWDAERRIVVCGGITGHRYLVAHRHTETAIRISKCCYDLDDGEVMHFHDWTVPPEEEVLAAKLILEHREPWLRNEATCLGNHTQLFKNPFGDGGDGTHDAGFTSALGSLFKAMDRLSRYDT